jgi:hypothetical protein
LGLIETTSNFCARTGKAENSASPHSVAVRILSSMTNENGGW